MNAKIMSFEEYAASKGLANTEEITESCDACGQEPCVCEDEEKEDELKPTEVAEEPAEKEDDEDDAEDDAEDDDDDDDDDDKENAEEAEDKVEPVSELMKKCYESAVTEVCEYHKDDYPDHTVESYLKENAALVAMLATKALEEAHAILDPEELTVEMYEAILNNMKESYNKKIDELKEAWSSK